MAPSPVTSRLYAIATRAVAALAVASVAWCLLLNPVAAAERRVAEIDGRLLRIELSELSEPTTPGNSSSWGAGGPQPDEHGGNPNTDALVAELRAFVRRNEPVLLKNLLTSAEVAQWASDRVLLEKAVAHVRGRSTHRVTAGSASSRTVAREEEPTGLGQATCETEVPFEPLGAVQDRGDGAEFSSTVVGSGASEAAQGNIGSPGRIDDSDVICDGANEPLPPPPLSQAVSHSVQPRHPVVSVRVLPRPRNSSIDGNATLARFTRQRGKLGYSNQNMSLAEFLDRYTNWSDDVLYLAQVDVATRLPGLAELLPPFPLGTSASGIGGPAATDPVTLYWGARAPITQLHYNSRDNVVCVLAGGWKRFRLVDPFSASALLYSRADRDGNTSPVPLDRPVDEWAGEYPLATYALPSSATLAPGDCLFLPVYWYHQVESAPARTVAVNWWRAPAGERKDTVGKLLCGHTNERARKTC